MKDYLMQFRDQVFNGALALYKRIFIPYLLLNIFVGIVSTLIIIPIMLKLIGWEFSDLVNLPATMSEISKSASDGGNPLELFKGLIPEIHYEYLIPLFLLVFIIYPWTYNLFLSLNDSEIRDRNNGLSMAISRSFSKKVFTLLGFGLMYYLLFFGVVFLFVFAVSGLMMVHPILGGLFGFVGFFFVIIFLIRFILGPPAIVHGNMSISEAFAFSFSKLTMKRSALLLLLSLVIAVLMMIVGSIASLIVNSIVNVNETDSMLYFITSQFISQILGAITGAFVFASLSALYFRYSADELPDMESDHIITD